MKGFVLGYLFHSEINRGVTITVAELLLLNDCEI